MATHAPKQASEIPASVEVTKCKRSRRGMRARALKLTAKPKARTVSWDVAEAFAKSRGDA